MEDCERLYSIVSQMLPLLRANGHADWARQLEGYAAEYDDDSLRTKHNIRRLYGGMGSFSDIVLQTSDGRRVVPDDDTFDRLRSELWQVCQPGR
jgi:hypothetical protein